ncbi:condensation domain-containing protein, partial [Cognatiluteimonas telluris]|uniref:condensation domain-containing protein n=1 Tax=Cognatiluteimonas telluris TaxID=1104775 RepID=UPI001A9CA26E
MEEIEWMSMNNPSDSATTSSREDGLRARREALSSEKLRLLRHRLKGGLAGSAAALVQPRPHPDASAPLSLPQQRLWFIEQLQGPSATYHVAGAYRLHGVLDRVAFRRTMDTIVARHESLRTRFVGTEAGPVQVIEPAMPFALDEVDLRTLTPEEREAAVAAHTRAAVDTPFDIVGGPLIRGRVLCLSADEHVLLVAMHHIVSDGWSMGVLVREVGA